MKLRILLGLALICLSFLLVACEGETMNRTAVLETNMGTIKIELFEDQMPITTKNFIDLAESGYYDGTKFHRVIADFMIQGGDPLSKDDEQISYWGTGGPGYFIADELVEGLSNTRGTLSMANSGPDTGGSQFFINLVDNTYLDYDKQPLSSKHPVFGQVVEGMDVVDAIGAVQTTSQNRPAEHVVLEKVTIE